MLSKNDLKNYSQEKESGFKQLFALFMFSVVNPTVHVYLQSVYAIWNLVWLS